MKRPPTDKGKRPFASQKETKLLLRETDRSGAALLEAEGSRGSLGQIDDALAMEGAAIVDGDIHGLARILVGYGNLSAEGQRAMRSRHGVFVEDFTGCGAFPVESGAVPRGAATLGIGCCGGECEESCSTCGGNNGFIGQWSMGSLMLSVSVNYWGQGATL